MLTTTTALTDRQLDGFACIHCGSETDRMVPVGFGPQGQLFECAGAHAPDRGRVGRVRS